MKQNYVLDYCIFIFTLSHYIIALIKVLKQGKKNKLKKKNNILTSQLR